MTRLLSILILSLGPLSLEAADVNITNVTHATSIASTDWLLGLTNGAGGDSRLIPTSLFPLLSANNTFAGSVNAFSGLTAGALTVNGTGPNILYGDNNQTNALVVSALGVQMTNANGSITFNGVSNTVAGVIVANNYHSLTNSGSANTPDFALADTWMTTNAAFTVLAPVHVDTLKKTYQTTITFYTNSTAAAVAITLPANVHGVGTQYVTNLTRVDWETYGGYITNAYFLPVF